MFKLDAGSKPSERADVRCGSVLRKTIILAVAGLVLAYPDYLHGQDDKGQPFKRSILGQSSPKDQKKNRLIGKRVVQRYRSLRLERGGKLIDMHPVSIYKVKEVNGSNLLLQQDATLDEYLARAEDVVSLDEAISFFTREIQIKPRDDWGYSMRARCWLEREELDRAISDLNRVILINPQSSDVFNNRGILWELKQDFDKALADFNECVRRTPDDYLVYAHRANLYLQMDKPDQAINDATTSIRLEPLFPRSYATRGAAWEAKDDHAKAMADLNKAIELNPYLVEAYIHRGSTLKMMKEYVKAIADWNKAIQLDPKAIQPHWYLGRILATCPDAKLRDGKKAVAEETKACELSEWKNALTISCLAAAYAETGDFDAALTWQAKANAAFSKDLLRMLGMDRLKLYREGKPYHEEP
jgi:tetratricopeptide (TPR) repeat protein